MFFFAARRHQTRTVIATTRFEKVNQTVRSLSKGRAHCATRAGVELKLTPKEFKLLSFLARHAGRVVTHEQILTAVWGPAHTEDTQYLRVYVEQLRQKIEEHTVVSQLTEALPGCDTERFAAKSCSVMARASTEPCMSRCGVILSRRPRTRGGRPSGLEAASSCSTTRAP